MKRETSKTLFHSLFFSESGGVRRRYSSLLAGFIRYLPFLLAAVSLLLLGWAGWTIAQRPYSGLTWSYQSGLISQVDPHSPAAGSFLVGDRILSIDGLPSYEARDLPGRKAGDLVTFTIERGQNTLLIHLQLARPGVSTTLTGLSTIFVGLFFWLPGLLVLAFGPSGKLVRYFFWLNLIFTLVLGLGSISSYGPLWCGWVFNLLEWWIGPLAIHVHLLLVNPRPSRRQNRVLYSLYILAFLFSLADLLRLRAAIPGPLITIKYLWVGATLLMAAGVLVFAYRKKLDIDFQRKTRIVGLSAFIAFLPFVLFSLLPEALWDRNFLPYEITFLALPVLPFGYSYAILRYKLIHLERYINRSAVYTLVIMVIGAFYGLVYILSLQGSPVGNRMSPSLEVVVMLALILGVHPLYRLLQRWVDKIFYGGWFDDRTATTQISQALTQAEGDAYSIALILCQALQKTMQLEYANLLLSDGHLITSGTPTFKPGSGPPSIEADRVAAWLRALETRTGRKIGPGRELYETLPSLDGPNRRSIGLKPHLWLVLDGKTAPQGLLILGGRRGGGELTSKDLEILEIVIRQAGVALENANLLQTIRQQVEHNRALQRQVFRSREEERKRIARDLHDRTVQALAAVNYQLANVRAQSDGDISSQVDHTIQMLREALSDLRRVCADLRPPVLDALGLIPAIQSRVADLQPRVSFEIELDIEEQFVSAKIPDDLTICIYRFLNEGIVNVQKHAAADWALFSMHTAEDNRIVITVEDNGQGFDPPRLDQLVGSCHFGLIGLQEQVEAIAGSLSIQSSPGHGCQLIASLPYHVEGSEK